MKKRFFPMVFILYVLFFGNVNCSEVKEFPKLSVVIPVYNVEKYVKECMDSVVGQSYKNIEVICVNDGSTDNSESLIRKYCENDDRVKVINQKNSGVSDARNTGISNATGEFITFVDPDDVLELNAYEAAIKHFEENNTDIVVWGYKTFPIFDSWYEHAGNVSGKLYESDSINAYFNEKSSTVVWNKIYRSSLIKNEPVKFKSGLKYGEDINFNLLVFPKARNIRFIPDKLYNYRIKREGSATTAFERTKKLENQFVMFENLLSNWNDLGYINGNESKIVAHFTELAYNEIEALTGGKREIFSTRFVKLMDKYIKRGSADGYPLKVMRKIKYIKQFAKLNQ